jgi:hypothetical protein
MKKRTDDQKVRLKMSPEVIDTAWTRIPGGSSADEPTPRVEPPNLRRVLQERRILWWGGGDGVGRSRGQEGKTAGVGPKAQIHHRGDPISGQRSRIKLSLG